MCQMKDKNIPDSVDIITPYPKKDELQCYYLGPSIYCVKRLRVCDRVMASHDACTSETSRVLTVASLQRLKMEALIPEPDDCEVRSVIKFLNAQSKAPIEIHRQLWARSMATHGSTVNTSPAGVQLDGVLTSSTLQAGPCAQWFPSFLTSREIPVRSASAFSKWRRGGDECHSGYKSWSHGMTKSQFRRWVCWKSLSWWKEIVKDTNSEFV